MAQRIDDCGSPAGGVVLVARRLAAGVLRRDEPAGRVVAVLREGRVRVGRLLQPAEAVVLVARRPPGAVFAARAAAFGVVAVLVSRVVRVCRPDEAAHVVVLVRRLLVALVVALDLAAERVVDRACDAGVGVGRDLEAAVEVVGVGRRERLAARGRADGRGARRTAVEGARGRLREPVAVRVVGVARGVAGRVRLLLQPAVAVVFVARDLQRAVHRDRLRQHVPPSVIRVARGVVQRIRCREQVALGVVDVRGPVVPGVGRRQHLAGRVVGVAARVAERVRGAEQVVLGVVGVRRGGDRVRRVRGIIGLGLAQAVVAGVEAADDDPALGVGLTDHVAALVVLEDALGAGPVFHDLLTAEEVVLVLGPREGGSHEAKRHASRALAP